MNRGIIKVIAPLVMFLVWSGFANAATGDMLYSNCASGNCSAKPYSVDTYASNTGWVRTVETSGCHSGNCLKLVGSYVPSEDLYGNGNTYMSTGGSVVGKKEITVSYWTKFDKLGTDISYGNFKQIIPYVGSDIRFGTVIVPWMGRDFYVAAVQGNFNYAAWFYPFINPYYVTSHGDSTGDTGITYPEGTHVAGGFDGTYPRPGTSWVKFTHYMKLPTVLGGNDAKMKVWVNDELLLEFTDLKLTNNPTQNTFSELTFYPSSEAKEPFEHWMDEMIIYEGYVPPVSDSGPTLSTPQPTSSLSVGTTSTTMSVSTDVASTCKYSTTPGTAYASMSNTMTGGGTTSHSVLISNLTNGSSTTYYLRCAKTSDGQATTTDFPITISVLNTQHSLTATKNGTGNGTLTSSPSGINCGSTCSYNFNENSSVIVTATPDSNSIFASWSGCTSTNGNQCTVTMNTAKNITATFNNDAAVCDADHYWACTDGPCQTQGFHFWEGACRTIAEPTDWAGENIAVNGTFANWTNNLPDSWNSYTSSGVAEDLGACGLYANTSSTHVYRKLPEIKAYRYVINVRNMTDNLEIWTETEGSVFHNATDGASRTVTGLVSYVGEGDTNIYIQVPEGDAKSAVIDDVVIKEVSTTAAFRFDVNSSQSITTTDALLTLRKSLGLSMDNTDWEESESTGDVNCDGNANSTDALLILRYSLGLSMSETEWCEGNDY